MALNLTDEQKKDLNEVINANLDDTGKSLYLTSGVALRKVFADILNPSTNGFFNMSRSEKGDFFEKLNNVITEENRLKLYKSAVAGKFSSNFLNTSEKSSNMLIFYLIYLLNPNQYYTEKYAQADGDLQGGGNKMKKTNETVMIGSVKRCVYKTRTGKKYVKWDGNMVSVTDIKKKKK
jgi:hypothetical protein